MPSITPFHDGLANPAETTGKTSVPPFVLTIDEAADALRMARSSIYKLMAAKRIKTVKFGRSRRIPVSELQRLAAGAR